MRDFFEKCLVFGGLGLAFWLLTFDRRSHKQRLRDDAQQSAWEDEQRRNDVVADAARRHRTGTITIDRKSTSTTKSLIAVYMILSSGVAQAALKSNVPADVCGYLATEKLPTRPWIAQDLTFGSCASKYREIGGAETGIPNNLAFYATGGATTVTQLELVLNLNQPQSDEGAIQELLKAAKALSVRASGLPLPPTVAQAIVARTGEVKAINGAVRISTIRKNWPNGKGYDLHVVFE